MSTELFAPFPLMSGATANIINPATGRVYTLSARGSVFVADADVPYFLNQGYIVAHGGGGGGAPTGVVPGSYVNTNLTVNAQGLLTAASSGTGGGGGGTGVSFDTRAAAIAATVPSTTDVIMTGGYAAPGDGGHGLYKRTSSIVYPTYGFTSSDGSHWEYIPEPTGWNGKAAGIVGDGVTDDAQNVMNALLPFQQPSHIVGGGILTGTLLLPVAAIALKSPVTVVGSNGAALLIKGQGLGAADPGAGTTFQWHGTVGYPSMFIVHGCNNFHLESVNFDGGTTSPASGLVNCIHLNSDNTVGNAGQITLTAAVTAGSARVFTCSLAVTGSGSPGIGVGAAIGVGLATPNFEIVYVTAVSGSTFTATCVHPHAIGEKVGSSPPCNNLFLYQCSIIAPVGSQSTGVLCGNQIQQTVQVSEFTFRNLVFLGQNGDGSAYSGIRAIVGGNIKNYSVENCSLVGFNTAIAGEALSGNVNLVYLTFFGTTNIDILANGSSNVLISNYESESGANINGNMMLKGTGGAHSQGATLIQNSYQCTIPNDQIVIDWAGSLMLINNTFFNDAVSGPAVGLPMKIRVSGITNFFPTGIVEPSGICSIGNYFQFGGPDFPIFYDGSNNALDYLDFSAGRRWCVSQFNDYGDEGKYHDKIGALSIPSAALSDQEVTAGLVAGSKGDVSDTFSTLTVSFAFAQTHAGVVNLWGIPPHTFITGIVVDVITPFKGTGITGVTVQIGNGLVGVNTMLKPVDIFTAAATYGLVDTDLGVSLAKATRLSPLGFASDWTNGTDFLDMIISPTGAALSALTQGSMVIYVMSKRLIAGAGLAAMLSSASTPKAKSTPRKAPRRSRSGR